jgi:hypothetical protein
MFFRHVLDTGPVPVVGVSAQLHRLALLSILAHARRGTPHPAHRDTRADARTDARRARKETVRTHRPHRPLRAPCPAHQNRDRPKARRPSRPRRLLRASSPFRACPLTRHAQSGAPVLRVNAAQSQVALPVRQVRDRPPSQILPDRHRPCSRVSMITLSSCTTTSCPQTQPSPPSMPCAKKTTYTRTRQSSLIAMCAFTVLPPPSLIPSLRQS